MKDSEKLTIRVKFDQQQNDKPKEEEIFHYHWGRIITGTLFVIIVIGSIIGGSVYYFDKDKISDNPINPPVAQAADISPTTTTIASSTFNNEHDSSSAVNTPAAIPPPIMPPELTEEDTPLTTRSIPDETIEPTGEQSILPKNSEQNTSAVDLVKSNVAKITADTSALENTDPAPLFAQSKTAIYSEHIKRFTIASSVIEKEPVGTIDDITFENNIATVYAFSEAINAKSTTLYYIWSLDGKNIAKVKVNVGADSWRSYSSKFIQLNMHGEWKVALQNEKGEALAVGQFRY